MKMEFDGNTFVSEEMLNKKGPLVSNNNGISRNTSVGGMPGG